eukprot:5139459-Prymnesium_polylepis.1
MDFVSCEAIYGAVTSFEHIRDATGKLHRFAISPSDHQLLRNLVGDLGDIPTVETGSEQIEWQSDGH